MLVGLTTFPLSNSNHQYNNTSLLSLKKDSVSFSSNHYRWDIDKEFRQNIENEIETTKTKIENNLGKPFNKITNVELFNEFGMLEKVDDDGLIILKEYKQPDRNYDWDDLGVNENSLFKNVKEIKGNANFSYSEMVNLDKLQKIGGWVNFSHSNIVNLGKLQEIGDWANFGYSRIICLANLKKIGTDAFFSDSMVYSLGNLKEIGADVFVQNSYLSKNKFSKISVKGIFVK